jgi:SAM-dependent methyltransferase
VGKSRATALDRKGAKTIAGLRGAMTRRDEFYRSYAAFKSWTGETSGRDDRIFERELAWGGLKPPAKILEIGFGDGEFLDWARRQGYSVTGVEIIGELVGRASSRGHRVFEGRVQSALAPAERNFDLVLALDVFEHMSIDELIEAMRFLKGILAPEGKILARFPNGASPFGAYPQSGDITHLTILSGARMAHIAHIAGLRLIAAHNAARAEHRPWLARRAGRLARAMIEIAIGQLYFGGRTPLDPEITVMIGHRDRSTA